MDSWRVPFQPSSVGTVRRALLEDLSGLGVSCCVLDDAALVMSELVANAVRHGAPLPGGGLCAAWSLTAGECHLEVTDGGHGVLIPEQVDASLVDLAASESGRGLTIVGLLSSRWGASCTGLGMRVWAELRLPVVAGAPAAA